MKLLRRRLIYALAILALAAYVVWVMWLSNGHW